MFTESCATSASTWEKSGLTVPSIARLALGVHFTSTPASSSAGSFTKPADGSAGSRGTPDSFAVTKGAATRWEAEGSPVIPVISRDRQTRQLPPRGIGLEWMA